MAAKRSVTEGLVVGDQLLQFEVREVLGEGGMGRVYRAHDSALDRPVALKVLPQSLAADPSHVRRLRNEARVLANLDHPAIARVYGLEETQGRHFLVLELVPGETLANRLRRGALAANECVSRLLEVAEALEEAHRVGVIHRDVKPSNIQLLPGGGVKLLDFGLAKQMLNEEASGDPEEVSQGVTISEEATTPGTLLGTVPYMSPEQARGAPASKQSDLWALGCTLFEALAGKHPFAGDTPSDTLAAILRAEPPWRALPEDTDPGVRRLLERCLAKDPQWRLRDAGDAWLELQGALQSGKPASPTAGSSTPLLRRPRRRTALSLIALVTVLTAALAWGFRGTFTAWFEGAPTPSTAAPTSQTELAPSGQDEITVRVNAQEFRRLFGSSVPVGDPDPLSAAEEKGLEVQPVEP